MMSFKTVTRVLLPAVVAATAIAALPMKSSALTFNFQFDNTNDGTVTPPIVGTGTFSFDGDPGDGTFGLTSLSTYNFSFNFGGDTFTNANIATPVANVTVQISTIGSDRFVNFGGSGGGPLGGSIDFQNNGNSVETFLSFQPNFGSVYGTTSFFGNYQGTIPGPTASVPEPSTLVGLLLVGGAGLLSKRQKQDH